MCKLFIKLIDIVFLSLYQLYHTMAATQPLTTTFIKHTGKYPLDISKFGITGEHFGMIINRVSEIEMDPAPILLSITIDTSGSMLCFQKISHVIKTLKNILNTILTKGMPIFVQLNTFNSIFETILDITEIKEENIKEILEKVGKIQADGLTNIELAITESQQRIEPHKSSFTKIHNLFLTDGHPTVGELNTSVLASFVSTEYPTTFIGYGCDHNYELLIECSNKHNESSYQLVDDYRNIGILCGELLHGICFPALKDVCININYDIDKSLYIFNEKENTFVESVQLGTFISGKEYRTPAMMFDRIVACIIHTTGTKVSNNEVIETELHVIKTSINTEVKPGNLTNDIFRYAVNRLLKQTNDHGIEETTKDIKELYKTIRMYAKEHDLLNDTFYKLLFDDLYSAYSSRDDDIYLTARIISNTRNQSFRSSSSGKTDVYYNRGALRQRNFEYDEEEEDNLRECAIELDEYDIENYNSENVQNDINNSQCMSEIIREVSSAW